ncbi:MAG: hypothetical protein WBN65_04570 [Gammaproteobacteria bacterium]
MPRRRAHSDQRRWLYHATFVLVAAALVAGCEFRANEDIDVDAGTAHSGDGMTMNGDVTIGRNADASGSSFRTMNGSITIKDGARVSDCATVNGTVNVGAGAESGDLKTVNGDLDLGRDARVKGSIKLVNGTVRLKQGSSVSGDIGTVNGRIELVGAEVGGDLSNVNGGMLVTRGSLVHGGLRIRDADGDPMGEPPRIVIGADSEVRGKLEFEREVELFVHESARIGPVSGATAVSFAGDEPG